MIKEVCLVPVLGYLVRVSQIDPMCYLPCCSRFASQNKLLVFAREPPFEHFGVRGLREGGCEHRRHFIGVGLVKAELPSTQI